MALLQSVASAKAESPEVSGSAEAEPKGLISSKTDKLILTPPHQEELLRMYAAHSSHASHSSHVSGTGHSSHYSATTYTLPSTPIYPPPTYPSQPAPKKPVAVAPPTTNSAVPTNTSKTTGSMSAATNSANAVELRPSDTAANSAKLESLTKQAAEGSSYAQYSLGLDYLYGQNGAPQNTEKAKMLLELAAVQGNAFAKERLVELNADASQPETKKK